MYLALHSSELLVEERASELASPYSVVDALNTI